MSLTRKDIRAFIEDESLSTEDKVAKIIGGHIEVVDGLKDKIAELDKDSKKLEEVQKELDTLKESKANDDDWQKKYEEEHSAFEQYKSTQEEAGKRANKEKLVSEYYKSKGIKSENSLKLAIGYSNSAIEGLVLDKDGKIKDHATLDTLLSNELSGLIEKTETSGAKIENPPKNEGGSSMTVADIMAIKDMDAQLKAIKENPQLFKK